VSILGVDASGRLSGAAVAAAGYKFAIRYLPLGTWKSVSREEVDDLVAHGVAVCLVWETTSDRATEGREAGKADAAAAVQYQSQLGIPADREIYYTVDKDVDPNVVVPYFQGVHDVLGNDGAYGGYKIVKRLQGSGLVKDLWQTVAWSGGQLLTGRSLFQRLGTATVGGVACDVNEAFVTDFGQHPKPKNASPPANSEGDELTSDDLTKIEKIIVAHNASLKAELKKEINELYTSLARAEFDGAVSDGHLPMSIDGARKEIKTLIRAGFGKLGVKGI
jgi:glycoside hydrolase-like protein